MKTMHSSIIVVLVSSALFVTSPAYASCIEGLGIDCNHYPPQALTKIQSNKLSYETSDKPVITIVGDPSAIAHLEIDDSSSNIIFTHDVNMSSNGTAKYVLDVSSYKPGVYSAITTSLISKLTTDFAVGLATTGGSIMLNTDKNSYLPGDNVTIFGWWTSNTLIQLSLVDPNGVSVKSTQIFSDKTGHFSSLDFSIPHIVTPGTWKIYGTSGVSNVSVNINVENIPGAQMDKTIVLSPLKQFKSGIAATNVECDEGFTLVLKAEDGSPACIKPDTAPKLIERGWTKEIVTNMSVESSVLNKTIGSELKIDLSNQTYDAGYPVYVNLKGVNQDSACKIPSISVRDESDQSVVFGPIPDRSYAGSCVDPWPITFYAGLEKNTLITKSTRYSILATLDNKTYQKEFTVIPSSYSNKNITADSTQIMPGYLTFTSCLPYPDAPPNNGTLIRYTGFDMYRRYLAGPDTGGIPEIDDYLLKPGYTGSFVLQVHQGQFSKDANLAGGLYFLSENLLNLDNSTVLNNKPIASEEHPGLVLIYTPSFATAGPEGYATITASISAQQNATRGTYWLYLPPGICGGNRVLLTIGEQPLAQPPDYIGYDFASHFAQGVGNPTKSDVTFELINAGIHTFENCSVNYVSENKTTTIKTFSVIPPGMEYKYYANLTSTSKISGFLECKNPSITKVYPDVWVDVIPY